MPNRLVNETSPYLLQHAHNPVDWYPWGEEALNRAKEENKPILVSIGYSACHWCHVMERESFENAETAALMNKHFINIKIDREERPDLDHIYMDAVQSMTGSGGWPLNVFLTPDRKPFYGGTYYPPLRAFNRASWTEVLTAVDTAFRERRGEIDTQAGNLTEHLQVSNSFGVQVKPDEEIFQEAKIREAAQAILKTADKEWGGFGGAPKFPQSFSIQFLLRYHYVFKDQDALDQALLSLDKMIAGGIYDQLGGGFARYSTDTEWLAPHFEKMLYDNALLIAVLSEAFQSTKNENYARIVDETMEFMQREMLGKSNGFYSALDADSEGVEGKFYVWSIDEVKKILEEDADIFSEYFDISANGNWEGANIPRIKKTAADFAKSKNISAEKFQSIIKNGKEKLLKERDKRVRPGLDDKVILGWNALMNTAASKAFAATGNESYRQLAIKNMQFIFEKLQKKNSKEFYHTWKNEQGKYPAFLDDHAFLIDALLHLYEITSDTNWIEKAKEITERVIENFGEPSTGFFFFTPSGQSDVIVRKKEVYDSAVPSGNSVMAYNLHRLSIILDKKEWEERSRRMISALGTTITRFPGSFGNWACLLLELSAGTREIAIVGEGFEGILEDFLKEYVPHRVLMASAEPDPNYQLLAGKGKESRPSIQLCRNYTCERPVFSVKELISLINRGEIG